MKMTTEEAFVKVLQKYGIEHAFGIIGSAMILIRLFQGRYNVLGSAHECNAGMMARWFYQASGKICMMVAQNGITNVTQLKQLIGIILLYFW